MLARVGPQTSSMSSDGVISSRTRHLLWILGLTYVVVAAFDATIAMDDNTLVLNFKGWPASYGFLKILRDYFFILDLRGQEYRLYGTSKVIHFLLWHVASLHAWVYEAFIAAGQFLSGIGIYVLLYRLNVERVQSCAIAAAWILSPFVFTSCFHFYSYLLLPYQLTIACCLVLQEQQWESRRSVTGTILLILFGFLIVTTGDTHLPAAGALLFLVALFTPSAFSVRRRSVNLCIVCVSAIVTLAVHRWGYIHLVARQAQIAPRFHMAAPTSHEWVERSERFFNSIPRGILVQVVPILGLAGKGALVTLLVVAVVAFVLWRRRLLVAKSVAGGLRVPTLLLLFGVLAIATPYALCVLANTVAVDLPRRYGFVPNTLFLMAFVALLAAPVVRRKLGQIPFLTVLGATAWLWFTLLAICLPIVRKQDDQVFADLAKLLPKSSEASVLFASNWFNYYSPDLVVGTTPPGLRSTEYPEIFESPLSNVWYEVQHVVALLPAHYAAWRAVDLDDSRVRLTGIAALGAGDIVYRKSLLVLDDIAIQPAPYTKGLDPFRLITYGQYEKSTPLRYHPGIEADAKRVTADLSPEIEVGWPRLVVLPDALHAAIDLGPATQAVNGSLPDKAYDAPGPSSNLIARYGAEADGGGTWAPTQVGSPGYFFTNRNGSFTYRIDFTDSSPKKVSLDLLEIWHPDRGVRLMDIDVAFDKTWFSATRAFDPASLAFDVPISLNFYPGSVRSFQVRVSQTPGSKDIPFLNGIRVTRLR